MQLKRKLQAQIIYLKQARLNRQYEKKGINDKLLEKQIALNIQRNELNIADKHEQNDGEYVQ